MLYIGPYVEYSIKVEKTLEVGCSISFCPKSDEPYCSQCGKDKISRTLENKEKLCWKREPTQEEEEQIYDDLQIILIENNDNLKIFFGIANDCKFGSLIDDYEGFVYDIEKKLDIIKEKNKFTNRIGNTYSLLKEIYGNINTKIKFGIIVYNEKNNS